MLGKIFIGTKIGIYVMYREYYLLLD